MNKEVTFWKLLGVIIPVVITFGGWALYVSNTQSSYGSEIINLKEEDKEVKQEMNELRKEFKDEVKGLRGELESQNEKTDETNAILYELKGILKNQRYEGN